MKARANDTSKQLRGDQAEARAESYLLEQGLELVERNFLCKTGEIDLIMRDGSSLVFVEVRYRKNANFGSALETVNRGKQKKIIAAAQVYLAQKRKHAFTAQRFDVIGITGDDVQWVRGAFGTD